MSDRSLVRTEVEGTIATVVVDRVEKMNALNPDVLDELERAFLALRDEENVRGVIVTGAGDRAFVAGADIAQLAEMDAVTAVEISRRGQAVFNAIERFPKPVVAAVGGYALGGGFELALACHLRVAGEDARFGLPEVGLGILPGYGGTARLSRVIGLGRAIEMTLTGDMIGADRALSIGLVSEVVPRASLGQAARDWMGRVVRNGPVAVRLAIESIYHAVDASLEEALRRESELFGRLAATEDLKEGTAAFLEKRKPQFQGR